MMILTLGIRDHSEHSKILILKTEMGNGSFHIRSCSGSTIYIEREKREQMDLKVYSDLKASLKKLHITAAKDVDYSGGNKTVVVIFLLVFKLVKAFQSRSYRLGLCFRMRTAFTYRSPRAASTYSVYSV